MIQEDFPDYIEWIRCRATEWIRCRATATALIVLLNFMDKNSDKTSDNNGLEKRNKKTA